MKTELHSPLEFTLYAYSTHYLSRLWSLVIDGPTGSSSICDRSASAVVWGTARWWVPKVVEIFARNAGFEVEFEVENISGTEVELEDIHLSGSELMVSSESIRLGWDYMKLLQTPLTSIEIGETKVTWSGQLAHDSSSATAKPFELRDTLLTPFPHFPFRSLNAESIELQALGMNAQGSVWMDIGNDKTSIYGGLSKDGIVGDFLIEENETRSIALSARLDSSDAFYGFAQPLAEIIDPEHMWPNLPIGASAVKLSFSWKEISEGISLDLSAKSFSWDETIQAAEVALLGTLDERLSYATYKITSETISGLGWSVNLPVIEGDITDLDTNLAISFTLKNQGMGNSDAAEYLKPFTLQGKYSENLINAEISELRSNELPVVARALQAEIEIWDERVCGAVYGTTSITTSGEGLRVTDHHWPLDGSFSIPTDGSGDLNADLNIQVEETAFFWVQDDLEFTADVSGDIAAAVSGASWNINALFQSLGLHLSLPDFDFSASFQTQIDVAGSDIESIWTGASPELLYSDRSQIFLSGEFDGEWASMPISGKTVSLEYEGDRMDLSNVDLRFEAANMRYDLYEFILPNGVLNWARNMLSVAFETSVIDPSVRGKGDLKLDFDTDSFLLSANIFPASSLDGVVLALHEFIKDFPTAFFTGQLQANVDVLGSPQTDQPITRVTGNISEGELTLPDSGIAINGIEMVAFEVEDFLKVTDTEPQNLKFDKLDFPPLELTEGSVSFRFLNALSIQITDCTFRFAGGFARLEFLKPLEAPYLDYSVALNLQEVDIEELTRLIPEFKDKIVGRIDARLPIHFIEGEISWDQGWIRLSESQVGSLQYADDGLIAPYIPELGLIESLGVDLKDVVRDITLSKLDATIQASDQFDEPSIIIIAGHSNHPKVTAPIEEIRIQLNAEDVPKLINQSIQNWETVGQIFNSK
jgi:hypothetical protein